MKIFITPGPYIIFVMNEFIKLALFISRNPYIYLCNFSM